MQEITIGRKQDNDVVLNDPMVGRCVAKVIRHDDGHYSIVDLMSTNGVYVNGKRIPAGGEIIIYNNDVIRIGNALLNLEQIILRARLRGISIDDPTFPPPNNAMCYCPVPPDSDGGKDHQNGSSWRRQSNLGKWLLTIIVSVIGFTIGILITYFLLN